MIVPVQRKRGILVPAQDGDTLEIIAARQTEGGNPMTADDIALFNWGATDPDHIQELMRDELGARARDGTKRYERRADDEIRNDLYLPERVTEVAVVTGKRHRFRLHTSRSTPQFHACLSLPPITFAFNSSFVRPDVAEHLEALDHLIASDPDAKLFIFGHTDAVGDDAYNKNLSERRAWAVHAFVLCDPQPWETLYNHPDEEWGLEVVQEILADLGHDPGPIDGDWGPRTRAAMRSFLGLPPEAQVKNDAVFRLQLFGAYMRSKHTLKLSPDRFMDDGFMGCGEFNLLQPTDTAEEKNRRVTFYFFNKDRLPNLPCAFDDTAPCRRQMLDTSRHIEGFSCSFYDSLARHCPPEAQSHTIAVLIDRHMVDNAFEAHSHTKLWLTGSGGYNRLLFTSAAVPFDASYYAMRFGFTPPGELYTLRKQMTDGEWLKVFEDVPYDEIDDHGDITPIEPRSEELVVIDWQDFEDFLDEHHPLPDDAHEPVEPWEGSDDDLDL